MADNCPTIFISYRRDDEPGYALSLYLALEKALGAEHIFKDIEGGFRPGDDFPDELRRQVGETDVLLAVIGPNWLTVTDVKGARRLDDPNDWVRVEIATALAAGKRVIPVLVNGARYVTASDLPGPLVPLADKQAHRFNNETFGSDAEELVRELRQLLDLPQAGMSAGGRRRFLIGGALGGLAAVAGTWLAWPARDKQEDWFTDAGKQATEKDQSLRVFEGHLAGIAGVRFRADGRTAASISDDQTVRIWDVETGKTLRQVLVPTEKELSPGLLSPDGRAMVRWRADAPAEFWDLDTGSALRTFDGINSYGSAAAFSHDGRFLAVSRFSGGAPGIWEVTTGRRILQLSDDWTDGPVALAFGPDNVLVASYEDGEDSVVRIIDATTGQQGKAVLLDYNFHSTPLVLVAAPDGASFVVFDLLDDGSTQLRSLPDAGLLRVLSIDPDSEHPASVQAAAYAPDGRYLVVGGTDANVHIFDARTGKLTRTLVGHGNWVQAVDVSRDGRYILSGSFDNTLRLWSMEA